VVREPGPLPGINTKITAILDPDGWKLVLYFYYPMRPSFGLYRRTILFY
jgi:hypothetical protein